MGWIPFWSLLQAMSCAIASRSAGCSVNLANIPDFSIQKVLSVQSNFWKLYNWFFRICLSCKPKLYSAVIVFEKAVLRYLSKYRSDRIQELLSDFQLKLFTWTSYEAKCITKLLPDNYIQTLNLHHVIKPMSFDVMTILINKMAKCLIVFMVIWV